MKVSFKITGLSSEEYCNILHLTEGGDKGLRGHRTPAIFLSQTDLNLYIASAYTSSQKFQGFDSQITLHENYQLEIHQRYKSEGVYKYSIVINGEEVRSNEYDEAQQFYDVKVYLANPFNSYSACTGTVSHFEITNYV